MEQINCKSLLQQLLLLTVWLPIKGYPNYEVSICGSVRNATAKNILKPIINKKGYYQVKISKNNQFKTFLLHRLVAINFLPNLNNDVCIDQKNNQRLDNTVSNLRWCTNKQNSYNRQLNKNSTSGIKGINWNKINKNWRVRISFNNKEINLGSFKNIEDAKIARQLKAIELYGEFINDCEL